MTIKHNFLKMYRKQSCLEQKDVAHLLNLDTGNLSRYEKGHRSPTIEIILTYHILFGASIRELFHHQYRDVKESLLTRSKELIDQIILEQSPKSKLKLSFLNNFVNTLSETKDDF